MRAIKLRVGGVLSLGLILLAACSAPTKAPDVTGTIKDSLKDAGLRDVSVSQDRDKSVVTLFGNVAEESDKVRAAEIAKSVAGNQVVANEIAVVPRGIESAAKTVNKDLDEAIKKNLDAVLIRQSLHDDVKYDVKNGVVILTGNVNSQATRSAAQKIAAEVPNVQQVVNKLEVKNQKATSIP
ncbi:MAG TPA: BON domain-containing protein [Bryobacteraceae bacterium]|jgi:hyperosmotically inducible protein|nr:BON domain-containing protein [Bryobacteraceae bacterium]